MLERSYINGVFRFTLHTGAPLSWLDIDAKPKLAFFAHNVLGSVDVDIENLIDH